MASEDFKTQLVRQAGRRKLGFTKGELAERLNVGHSYVSRAVNECLAEGRLVILAKQQGERGRPAPKYGTPQS